MLEDLTRSLAGLGKKDKVLLTIRIGGKYMGDREDFRRALRSRALEEGQGSLGTAPCAVCGKVQEVSGDLSPFKFYTIDKPGYIVGGFDKKQAYKAFPLCYDCRGLIQRGRQHVEKHLTFAFAPGIRYMLIPDFLFGPKALHREVLDILTIDREQRAQRLHRLKSREWRRITQDEEDILDVLSEEQDAMTMHFLFMPPPQGTSSQELIELYIQDVYPSRLRELFQAKEATERLLAYQQEDGTFQSYTFTYATLHRFFSKATPDKRNPDLQRHFYEVIDRTFRGVSIPESYLIPFLMRQIRNDVTHPDRRDRQKAYRSTIQDALAVLMFVQWATEKEVARDMSVEDRPSELESFLDALPVLDNDLKKGLFLLGTLTERLLRVQYSQRESAPFWKTLKGLKLTETDLRGLLPKARSKLQEYDKFGPGEVRLFESAARFLAQVPTPWKMNMDELNFYFALGMGLFDQIAPYVYQREPKEGNHEQPREEPA
jgi:CRISPR-associated protein Csh1